MTEFGYGGAALLVERRVRLQPPRWRGMEPWLLSVTSADTAQCWRGGLKEENEHERNATQ
jgi:hypothetical protein